MAADNAKAFIEKMLSDPELQEKVGSAGPEDITGIAKELGFDTSAEEIEKVYKEMRSASGDIPEELSEDEIDNIAGGRVWCGEDAPDDHEMGCSIFYHGYSWQEENDVWCKKNYFCQSGRYAEPSTNTHIGNCSNATG